MTTDHPKDVRNVFDERLISDRKILIKELEKLRQCEDCDNVATLRACDEHVPQSEMSLDGHYVHCEESNCKNLPVAFYCHKHVPKGKHHECMIDGCSEYSAICGGHRYPAPRRYEKGQEVPENVLAWVKQLGATWVRVHRKDLNPDDWWLPQPPPPPPRTCKECGQAVPE